MMKKIGVTGAAGFIGSYVVEELHRRGYDVLVMDHALPGTVGIHDFGVETFFGDVRDETAVFEFAAHVDGIIHLAAVLGTQETIQNPKPSVETNIMGSLNVFEAAARYDLPVVYAGVGNHFMASQAGGSYTITKTTAEYFAKTYNANKGSRISVVRPVNAYGPRQSIAAPYGSSKVRKIMPSLVCRALVGDPLELYGGGKQISDCVHVADVARVFVKTLEYTEKFGPVTDVEVGPSDSVSVYDIAKIVIRVSDSSSGIVSLPMRPGEVPNAVVSSNTDSLHIIDEDASTFISLEDGIKQTVRWYRENWLPGYLEESK